MGEAVQRQPASLSDGELVMGTVLMFYLGFARLHHVRYVRDDEMLQEVLGSEGRSQSTFWRFLASFNLGTEGRAEGPQQLDEVLKVVDAPLPYVRLQSILQLGTPT